MNATSLQWVHDEVRARLNDARLAVEAHASAPDDWEHLERCIALVGQIHRVLAVVGVHGAALLVEETGALARDLIERRVACSAETHEALMRALVDLADHLDRLRAGWRENPLDLLEMVNDVRGARGMALVDAGVLYAPPLWSELPADAVRRVRLRADLRHIVRRLRALYQVVLLAVLRAGESDAREPLLRMDEVLERMELVARKHEALRLWWVARALVQNLSRGDVELTVAVKRLLGQLDVQMRDVIREGEAALDRRPPAGLLRHLLYYVAHSPAHEGRSGEVKQVFALDALVTSHDGTSTLGRHAAALSAVAGPLEEQLGDLEGILNGPAAAIDSASLAPRVHQLAVTFGLLGADELREALRTRGTELQAPGQECEELYLGLAEDLLRARAVVASLKRPDSAGIPDAAEVVQIRYREAVAQAAAQIRRETFAVKEGLSAYASGDTDAAALCAVADGIDRTLGILRLLGYEDAAELASWASILRSTAQTPLSPLHRSALEELAGLILDVEADLDAIAISPSTRSAAIARAPARRATAVAQSHAAPRPVAVPQAARSEPAAALHGGDETDEAMDEELREVFAEEMKEVIETLRELVPEWTRDPGAHEALMEIRRAFHTLKGSGRVVGAMDIGDFAWSVEHVLNRIIDGSIGTSPSVGTLVSAATEVLPEVLGALKSGHPLPSEVEALRRQAEGLAA